MPDMQVFTTVSCDATLYRFSQKAFYLPLDGTLHYLKMLEVIAAFGIVIFSDNNLPGEMGKKQRCKGAEE